jgi:plastocyanin
VHTFALKLGLVLATEKSKTPFYIAGGVLVAWALFISLGIGMRKPDFPSSLGQQRAIMAVSAVLVVLAVSMAVVTSGGSKSKVASTPAPVATSETTAATPTPTPTTTSTPTPSASTPTATTGTPAPPSSPAAKATTLALAANPQGQLSYDTTKLAAKAGKVTIEMANASPVEHNVTLAQGTKVLGATPTFTGGKKGFTVTLAPGTYTFYCSVPGHRQAGMEGVLTVSS